MISRVAAHRGPPVLVSDRACSGVADTTGTPVDCGPPFTRQERKAIRSRVEESPVIRFVSNPGGIEDRIFRRTGAGTGSLSLVRLGPIFPMGDRVQVEVSSYCGGLCGSWMTLVLERTSGGWEVTGTTGPVAIS